MQTPEKGGMTRDTIGSQKMIKMRMMADQMSTRGPAGLMTHARRRGSPPRKHHLHPRQVPTGLEKKNGTLQEQQLHRAHGISQVNPQDGIQPGKAGHGPRDDHVCCTEEPPTWQRRTPAIRVFSVHKKIKCTLPSNHF